MPRFRFTVRRMMAVVAFAALLLIGVVLWQRSGEYRRRAEMHDSLLWSELPVAIDEAASPGASAAACR